jgi:hypothetical protein
MICSTCGRQKSLKSDECAECGAKHKGDQTTFPLDQASRAKLILSDKAREVHLSRGVKLRVANEAALEEMGIYTTLAQHSVRVREAVREAVLAGMKKPMLMQAIREGADAAVRGDEVGYLTGGGFGNGGGPRNA